MRSIFPRLIILSSSFSPSATAGFVLGSQRSSTHTLTTSSASSSATTTTTGSPMLDQQQQKGQQPDGGLHDVWTPGDPNQQREAQNELRIWPLDEYNAALLNQVHPRGYTQSTTEPHEVYDLIALGAGAGGLVSSKQSARRGAKSAMISDHLAGGDCLNVGCVPSKALLAAAKAVAQVRQATTEWGIVSLLPQKQDADSVAVTEKTTTSATSIPTQIHVNFAKIMERVRQIRSQISPADGHPATTATGAHVYQGRGKFLSASTIQVGNTILQFKKAVIATGGRPMIPKNIPGLLEAPYITHETLFNLQSLPPRMIVLGSGVVALELSQAFSLLGTQVTVLQRASRIFSSKHGDMEAAAIIQNELEKAGVTFCSETVVDKVTTLRPQPVNDVTAFPLMRVSIRHVVTGAIQDLDCEVLLVATGRLPNVENLGLEEGNIQYKVGEGIIVNDHAQSISNPNVYAVGDCVEGVPRLTHMSGEMAKLVIQNALFQDDWKLSSLVVPAVMYTEPEFATVGIYSAELATQQGVSVDIYRAGLEHNDRAICDGTNIGFCKIVCKAGTDEIVGATIVAERAGEMINEISLAMKNGISLRAIGRNIHPYPTMGEAVMGCGIQYINSNWKRL